MASYFNEIMLPRMLVLQLRISRTSFAAATVAIKQKKQEINNFNIFALSSILFDLMQPPITDHYEKYYKKLMLSKRFFLMVAKFGRKVT